MWTRTLILLSTIYSRYSHRNKLQDAHRFVLLESDEKCWNRESKCFREKTWKKAGAGEENGTKSVRVQLKRKNSVFMMLRQGLSCYGWCPGFWVWGSLVSGWRTMMEESRWRIKAGLIAYGLLTHLHLPKGDPWGLLAPPQLKPAFSSAAIVWIWLMRPSLTFTSYRTSQPISWFQTID